MPDDHARPVSITVVFGGIRPYTIRDAFALAATDGDFGVLFQAVMVEIAEL